MRGPRMSVHGRCGAPFEAISPTSSKNLSQCTTNDGERICKSGRFVVHIKKRPARDEDREGVQTGAVRRGGIAPRHLVPCERRSSSSAPHHRRTGYGLEAQVSDSRLRGSVGSDGQKVSPALSRGYSLGRARLRPPDTCSILHAHAHLRYTTWTLQPAPIHP